MRNVYLLKDYKENSKGDIITESNNVANGLVETGIGRLATNRDYLIKPEIGNAKAFVKPPSKRYGRKKIVS